MVIKIVKYILVIWSIFIWEASQAALSPEKKCPRFTKCVPFGSCGYALKHYAQHCNNSDGAYVCCPFFEPTSTTEKGILHIKQTMLIYDA